MNTSTRMEERKRWFRKVILGGIILFSLNIYADTIKFHEAKVLIPELQKIIKRGKLIVAIHAEDHFPFHMRDKNGKFIGIDIEIAETIAKYLNVSVEYKRSARVFDEVIDLVVKGEADIAISELSYTPERALRVAFSKPYIMLHKALLVSRLQLAHLGDTLPLKALFALKDVKIGTLAGSSYVSFAKDIFPPSLELFTDANWDQIIKKLVSGDCFGAFFDDNEFRTILLKNPKLNLNLLTVVLKKEEDPICIVLPLGQPEFLRWTNDLLTNVKTLHFELGDVLKKYKDKLEKKQ